jgi:FixJ family two-component response regulator
MCINVASAPFWLVCDVRRPEVPVVPAQPRVYIVDDNEAVRASLRLLVELEGLSVEDFDSGRAFLDACGASPAGCLVLDVHMPDMSGIEVLETLRRRGIVLPTILVTGRSDRSLRERARAAGAVRLVEKPFVVDAMLDLVRSALDGGGAARPGADGSAPG